MIVTEAEAMQRWCPFARVHYVGQNVMNRVSTFQRQLAQKQADAGDGRDLEYLERQVADANCLGSRCMAWHWAGYQPVASRVPGQDEAHGFCGLAGKPPLTD